MNSIDYENKILDAIETITNNAIAKAGYDKTIQATIINSVDDLIGKYIVKYQDSEFEVYSNNIDIYYPSGTLVNVSIPNGDFNLRKTIVSAATDIQVEYTNIIEEKDKYTDAFGNTIPATQQFGVCSYKDNDICVLYDRDTTENNINIDIDFIENNIKTKENILCGAEFKTALDYEQQKIGNYGIVFEIDFLNPSTQETITNQYIVDINEMQGNPYQLLSFVEQYKIFKIDAANFISIKKIYLFAKDFSLQELDKENDIFAQNFEFYLLDEIETDLPEFYDMQIQNTNTKKYFDNHDANVAYIKLKAKLQYKNQYMTSEDINFYWFKENTFITNTSEAYCFEGGPGWECLNEYNISDGKRYYISNEEISITKESVSNNEVIIKCVASRDNRILATQSYTILNYDSQYKLTISSSDGDTFYFNNGHPTLTCLINGEDVVNQNDDVYTYSWGYVDSNSVYHQLIETPEENLIYNTAKEEYDALSSRVAAGIELAAASQEELDRLLAIVEKYNQRIENNKVHDVDLTKILDQAIFKCAVIKNGSILLGTANFTIYNKKETEGEYYLDILNGTQAFHYTVNGIAPTNTSLMNPITIEPLKVILYDSNGNLIPDEDVIGGSVHWIIPTKDTLIIAEDSEKLTLDYQLADNYDENKLYNNNIEVTVFYKGLFLKKQTTFTFTKDGEPGTNGTDVICKIVPNTPHYENGTIDTEYENNCYPMIVNGKFNFGCLNYEKTIGYDYFNTDQWFKVQLWKEGQVILDTPETIINYDESTDTTQITKVQWSILKNKYSDVREDESSIDITKEIVTETIKKKNNNKEDYEKEIYHFSDLGYNENAANIVKVEVEYNNVIYYAAIPVITVQLVDQTQNYSIELKTNTGFRSAKYNDDGKSPLYSTNVPFTIRVMKEIDGYTEDISTINNEYALKYEWSKHGRLFNYTEQIFNDVYDFTLDDVNNTLEKNEMYIKPNDFYNGQNVSNAVEVDISTKLNNILIGKIHIPLYFYLDRYRHTALNGWDGNSISLNNKGGIVLAPQVGAGHKEQDGSFTGLLLGSEWREGDTDNIETGLLGYYKGDRTLFLDSQTGRAEFGSLGSGQIIVDPKGIGENNEKKLVIYGGNYTKKDTENSVAGSGLLIDLTSPSIEFGSQKFVVTADGTLRAIDAILSGNMSATAGTFGSGSNKIKIGDNPNVEYSFIYSGDKVNIDADTSGFYLGTNGIGIGKVGGDKEGSAFKVTAAGELFASNVNISGNINATSGKIGNWYIDNGAIKFANNEDFYLNNDGSVYFGNFMVDKDGNVNAQGIKISGGQFDNGSIVLKGDETDQGNRNGLIVGDFDFADPVTYTNPRNCVGRDCIISRGQGTTESSGFHYSKIKPGIINICNSNNAIKLDMDMVGTKSLRLTSSDSGSYMGIWNGSSSAYMKATGVWAAGYNQGSLESKKKNIVLDEGCLNQILNTDIVDFNWKFEDDGDQKHVGLIIPDEGGNYKYPEKVLTHDRDAVDLYSAVMMAWKALQEMQAEIDEIKGE